jgi:hypothetical protein
MKYTTSFLFVSIIVLFLTSCDKFHAKKLAGTYSCRVDYHYWDMTPKIIDSTYQRDIEVKQKGKLLEIFSYSIPIDSLWKERQFSQGDVHSYLKVLFKNDSVYITSSGGGLGGNSSTTYSGRKIK